MLRIPELAMPKTRKVTTVYNGKKRCGMTGKKRRISSSDS